MRGFVADVAKNPEKYVENPKDFSRKRKLDLSKTVFLQIGLLKHSLQKDPMIDIPPRRNGSP
jgi:hypothetical protein